MRTRTHPSAPGRAPVTLCELQRLVSEDATSKDWHKRLAWLSAAEVKCCDFSRNTQRPHMYTTCKYGRCAVCRFCWGISVTFRNGGTSSSVACSFWRTQRFGSGRQSATAQGYLLRNMVLKLSKACKLPSCRVLSTTGCVCISYIIHHIHRVYRHV